MKAPLVTAAAVFSLLLLTISLAQAQPGSLDLTFNPGSGIGSNPNASVRVRYELIQPLCGEAAFDLDDCRFVFRATTT